MWVEPCERGVIAMQWSKLMSMNAAQTDRGVGKETGALGPLKKAQDREARWRGKGGKSGARAASTDTRSLV